MSKRTQEASGILDITDKGFGFLRDPKSLSGQSKRDVFVRADMVRKFRLRPGLEIHGTAQPGRNGSMQLAAIERIGPLSPEDYVQVKPLDEGISIDPDETIRLETTAEVMGMRVMDLMTPIGKGQRGLIVAPPRTGKTILLQQISNAVTTNHPEIHLMLLLVDERPEEVTEMQRSVQGEVIASSNDRELASHVRTAKMAIEKARRLAEFGQDVVLLVDSITRVGRSFNNWVGSSGKTLSGGLDSRALSEPKRIFGSARNIEGGGSLTIIATALIDTGSRMDNIIFEEFKGTGNMELVLDRDLANRRVWPAMDLLQSGTRKEERLIPADKLRKVNLIRRALAGMKPVAAMEQFLKLLEKHPTNDAVLESI